jgi:hypothetical protein
VEDVGFGEVVHALFGTNGDGGGKFAAAQAIEEEESGDIAADCFRLKSGKGLEAAIDFVEAGNPVGGEVEGFDAFQEVVVGITLPTGPNTRVERPPRLMIFFRI